MNKRKTPIQKSKLIAYLQDLEKHEFKAFGKFLKSPYHNPKAVLYEMYEGLKPFYPKFDKPILTREWLYEKIYPNKKFSLKTIKNMMSEMIALVEDFWVEEKLKNTDNLKEKLLIQAASERKLPVTFNKQCVVFLQKKEPSTQQDYLDFFEVNKEWFFHFNTDKYQINHPAQTGMMQNLDNFYVLSKMKYATEIFNRQQALQEASELPFFYPELAGYLGQANPEEIPSLIWVYYQLSQLFLTDRDDRRFQMIKQFLKKNMMKVPLEERSHLLTYLENYALRMYFKGDVTFKKEELEIFEIGLKHGVWEINGRLPERAFLNYILITTNLKLLSRAQAFIETYKNKLRATYLEEILAFSTTLIFFHQKKYQAAFDELMKMHITFPGLELNYRSLRFRVQYELAKKEEKQRESLIALLKASQRFLTRNKLIGSSKIESYLNLIHFIKKLLQLRAKSQLTQADLSQVETAMDECHQIVLTKWLKEKLQEIKQDAKL